MKAASFHSRIQMLKYARIDTIFEDEELSDVTFYYGTKKKQNLILKDVSCRFEEGESYAIIGKSSIGKSTTILLLGGMEKPKKA